MATLSWADWSWEPTVLVGLLVISVAYALAWRRAWLRDDDDVSAWFQHPRARIAWFSGGIVVAFVALQSPIDTGGDQYLFSLHMLQHVLLMMVAPPMCLLGIAGGRHLPRPHTGFWAVTGRVITNPWVAIVIFNAVMLVWHLPSLYNATLTTEWIHIVEHISFVAVGVVFWWPIVDPFRGVQPSRHAFVKIVMLALSGLPPTILGLLFTVAHNAYYSFYVSAPRLWGLDAVTDQQIAGVIMFGLGNLIYFAAVAPIFWRLLGGPDADDARAPEILTQRLKAAAAVSDRLASSDG